MDREDTTALGWRPTTGPRKQATHHGKDHIHLTVDGGDRLAERVRAVIAADWPLPDTQDAGVRRTLTSRAR